ncbi:energy transducer TonB [Olleya sp. R77988]|uniref:energy transducer TonB n=1 Tax=Olleya sp. R77988 TaxID=3093875 RepID=UPI0037C72CBB
MKKNIIIFCALLITLSVTAYTVLQWDKTEVETTENEVEQNLAVNTPKTDKKKPEIFTDFIYDIGSRFEPIKINDLHKATSISDFISPESFNSIIDLKSVRIIIIKDESQTDIQELGYTKDLTAGQIKLLQSLGYSDQFNIRSEFTAKNPKTGMVEDKFDSPHLSVVSEKQATYPLGKDLLKKYLKEKSATLIKTVDPYKLQAAKLYFVVTKDGSIKNVRLDRTSKYPEVDKKMINLIKTLPEAWIPAENDKGEKIDQEMVVSFGLMGC